MFSGEQTPHTKPAATLAQQAQYLCIAEIEFYGFAVAQVGLPPGAVGWATNGSIWVPYYAGG